MPSKERNYPEELRLLMNALAESVAQASDEEILAELGEGGETDEEADRVRGVLLRAVHAYKRRRLQSVRAEYEKRAERIKAAGAGLPDTPGDRRTLLQAILAARPQLQAALTVQFRGSEGLGPEELPDDQVDSYLRQLQELGVLEEFLGGPEGR